MGLAAVFLTAFYMTRLVAEVFFGAARTAAAEDARESPAVMTIPLVLLSIAAVGLGFAGTPAWPWLQSRLGGAEIPPRPILEAPGLMAVSILLVGAGLGAGWALYGRRPRVKDTAPDPLAAAAPPIFACLSARLGFDEFYAATFGRLTAFGAAVATGFDRWVWGAAVDFLARFGEFSGMIDREADEDGLNTGFDAASEGLRDAGRAYSRRQTGETHGYLRVMAVAFVALVLLILLGGNR